MALEKGYFREAGIDLTIEHGFDETEGLTRIATGNLQFGMISGEQVLLARGQGARVNYVYRWYQKFPVGVVVPADSAINTPSDLKGKIVGVPAKFGASYIGLQALLNAADLTEADLQEVRAIGFDTAPFFCEKQIEAAVVYVANEPVQLADKCFPVRVIAISDYANLVSNGIVTNETTFKEQPELVGNFVAAFHKGLRDTIADPDEAYAISRKYVENLPESDEIQMQVLKNSIALWQDADGKLGLNDASAWKLSAETLTAMGLLQSAEGYESAYSNAFVPNQE